MLQLHQQFQVTSHSLHYSQHIQHTSTMDYSGTDHGTMETTEGLSNCNPWHHGLHDSCSPGVFCLSWMPVFPRFLSWTRTTIRMFG